MRLQEGWQKFFWALPGFFLFSRDEWIFYFIFLSSGFHLQVTCNWELFENQTELKHVVNKNCVRISQVVIERLLYVTFGRGGIKGFLISNCANSPENKILPLNSEGVSCNGFSWLILEAVQYSVRQVGVLPSGSASTSGTEKSTGANPWRMY